MSGDRNEGMAQGGGSSGGQGVMPPDRTDIHRPIRVVMFGSGPALNHDARRFLRRLASEPDIELLGAFCQARSTSVWGVFKDLWTRRGILAFPLFIAWAGGAAGRFLRRPRAEMSLRRDLRRLSSRIRFVLDIHDEAVIEGVRALEPDLGLVYGSPILRPELFEIPAFGTLGIHHGKVPEYRGNKTTFWAIYNGEETAGVTIQKIEAGLDTGRIVKEGTVPTGGRSLRSVVRDLEDLGLDLYIRAIREVREGSATYRPQPGPRITAYRNPKLGDLFRFHLRQVKRLLGWRPPQGPEPQAQAPGADAGAKASQAADRREPRP